MKQIQEPDPQGSESSTFGTARSWLSNTIVGLGVIWVVMIGTRELDVLQSGFRIASPAWLAFSVLGGIVGLLLTACLFRLLLRFQSGLSIGFAYAARLLFVGQVLRHLPGRVWGIVYLVNETSARIAPSAMIRANVELMCYSLAFHLIVSATLYIGFNVAIAPAAAVAAASIAAVTISLRGDWLGRSLQMLFRYAPTRLSGLASIAQRNQTMRWSRAAAIVGLFVAIWCAYLSVWYAFSQTFRALDGINVWLLCASYSIAWVGGYLSAVTPAGLGVREAGFFVLASQLTSLSTLTFLAVFVRLWQVAVEMLLFAIFFFAKPNLSPSPGSPRPFESKA